MDEYIRKQDAVHAIMGQPPDAHYPSWYAAQIKAITAADVVPVVRCRDCKRWNNGNVIIGCYWDVDGGQPEEMDFCSRGERREE